MKTARPNIYVRGAVMLLAAGFALLGGRGPAPAAPADGPVRDQRDTVGFAVTEEDFLQVLAASVAAEGLNDPQERRAVAPAVAAILPHDDYLYAGRTAVHALPHLQARRWIVLGVCHACRRLGVRDRLLLDDYAAWRVAGKEYPVDAELRDAVLAGLDQDAEVSRERHAQEHSIEALLPWLGAGAGDFTFVPILVPGMEADRLAALAERLAGILDGICRERGWNAGRDLALAISADAVHYGCEGWGDRGYAPFGCDEAGHAAGRAQDVALAEDILAGPLDRDTVAGFIGGVWNPEDPEYPAFPYRITWCGLYSIPFGLTVAQRLWDGSGEPPLTGQLLRYGDSVSDGRLAVAGVALGVTAPNTLAHWVGYPALVYTGPLLGYRPGRSDAHEP